MTDAKQPSERALIQRYFQAMRTGTAASDDIVDLFADDAIYVEPFGAGRLPMTHVGKEAIRRSLRESQTSAPRDMTLRLDQIDIEGTHIRTVWTCTAPQFPHPMHGEDLWEISEGKIQRLETKFIDEIQR